MPENIDLIMGGIGAVGQGLKPFVDRQQAQLDRNEPLSPYEKARALVMQGRMDPREAATRLKLGLPFEDGGQAPQGVSGNGPPTGTFLGGNGTQPSGGGPTPQGPSAQASGGYMAPSFNAAERQWDPMPAALNRQDRAAEPAPSYGYSPGMSSKQSLPQVMSAGAYPPERMKPYYPGAALDVRAPTIMSRGPQTRGELDTMLKTMPQSKDTPLDRMERLMYQEHQRTGRADQGDETKRRGQDIGGASTAARLTEAARSSDNQITLGYDKLDLMREMLETRVNAKLREIDAKGGVDRQLEALKLRVTNFGNKFKARTALLNGLGTLTKNPAVAQAVKEIQDELSQDSIDLWTDVNTVQETGNFGRTVNPTRQGTGAAPIPQGAPKGTGVGGPPLSGPSIQEPDPNVEGRMGTAADRVVKGRSSSMSSSTKGPISPTGKTKTDANGQVWEEMSDGTARKVR